VKRFPVAAAEYPIAI